MDDTDKILEQNNYKLQFSQALILTKNIQTQMSKQIKTHKDKFQDFLDQGYLNNIPFSMKNMNVNISLQNYYKENLNKLGDPQNNYIKEYLEANDIFEYEILKDVYENKKRVFKNNDNDFQIENTKQVNDIIRDFSDKTYSNEINKIKDNFGFSNFNDYFLEIIVNINEFFFKSHYILDKEGKVKNFEISFK